MPTIKTIRPTGGGDFADIQSWWDWAYTQPNPNQWAECYGGGDLGTCNTIGKVNPYADASNYPRIYAAPGHTHNLQASTAFAHSTSGIWYLTQPYMRVNRILFYLSAGANAIVTQANGEVYIDGILVIGANDNDIAFYSTNSAASVYWSNCLVYGCGGSGYFADTPALSCWWNCGAVNCGNNIGAAVFEGGFGSQRNYHQFRNCYSLNSTGGSGKGFTVNPFAGTPNIAFCATFDSTANSWGGSNNLINVANSGHVVDLTSDWFLLSTSAFRGTGTYLASVLTDAVGNTRTVPYSIGPSQPIFASFKPAWARNSNFVIGKRKC